MVLTVLPDGGGFLFWRVSYVAHNPLRSAMKLTVAAHYCPRPPLLRAYRGLPG